MTNHYDFVKANPGLFKQFSCNEALFLIIDCPPEFVSAEDWIDHNCILHVITGNHLLFSRERSWLISKGATVFIKKGGIGIQKVDEESFCALMFYVPDSYIHSTINDRAAIISQVDTVSDSNMLIKLETNDVLIAFFNSVLSYLNSEQKPSESLLELKFKELLLNIIANPANRELSAYLHKVFASGNEDLRDLMERNYMYNLSVDQFARLCHRSLSKFKRDFDRVFGMPPGRWIIEKRLEHARCILPKSKKAITDIVVECGFTNITHFDRVFKKHFGETPIQYRKKYSSAAML